MTKDMKWEVKALGDSWGVFLEKEFCKTDEQVCYGMSRSKSSAEFIVKRMNDPDYWVE